jgi:hypothetical protein
MMTEEQIIARLQAARLDRPRPAPPPPPKPKPAQVRADERFAQPKPHEAIAQQAALSAEAFAQVVQQDTSEARRRKQEVKEMAQWVAEGQDPRARYQRELDRFTEASRAIEAALEDDHVYVGGFWEPRYRTTCHKGKGDPDWGLR